MRTSEQPVLMFICTKKQKIYACAMGRSSIAAAVSCCAAVASPGAAAVAPAPNLVRSTNVKVPHVIYHIILCRW